MSRRFRIPDVVSDLARRHRETWGLPRVPGDDEGMVCRHAAMAVLRRALRLGLPSREVRLQIDQRRAPSNRYTRHVIPEVFAEGRWWAIETWRQGGSLVSAAAPYSEPGESQPLRDPRWYERIGQGRAFERVLGEVPDDVETGWVVEYAAKRMRLWQHQRDEADRARERRGELQRKDPTP